MTDTSMKATTSTSNRKLSTQAIGKVRVATRRSKYLMDPRPEPSKRKKHTSMDGTTEMSSHLITFHEVAKSNRLAYFKDRLDGKHSHLKSIAVTREDAAKESDIRNQSVKDIDREILILIDRLPGDLAAVMEDDFRRNVKKKKKDVHVDFYHRLQEELTNPENYHHDLPPASDISNELDVSDDENAADEGTL